LITYAPTRTIWRPIHFDRMSDPAELLAQCERQARARPGDPAALGNFGIMLQRFGRLGEAEHVLRRALVLGPGNSINRFALGLTLLAQGRFAEGWSYYEARGEAAAEGVALSSQIKAARWRGEGIAGKRLLVMPEQGLGDQLQFARVLPKLAETGAKLILVSHPPLHGLFQASFPSIQHVVAGRVSELPSADFWVSLLDVLAVMDLTPADLPPPPYLRTDTTWRNPPAGVRIGLMASGNRRHPNNARRSLAAANSAYLRSLLPGTVIDLDPDQTRAPTFSETAAILNMCDLVVSVDTAAAHLAGALNRPCLLLLPGYDTDWRWMRDRSDSPWYPRHILLRNTVQGDWRGVIEAAAAYAREVAESAEARSALPS